MKFGDELCMYDTVCETVVDFDGIIHTQHMGHIMVKSAIERVYEKEGWIPKRDKVPNRRMLRGYLMFKLRILK